MGTRRCEWLDVVKGISIVSMVFYHGCWDWVNFFGCPLPWFSSRVGYIWQQSICWVFILVSGWAFNLGRHKLRHSLKLLFCGILVSTATLIYLPQEPIIFGILFFLGVSALFLTAFEKYMAAVLPAGGLSISLLLFALTRNLNRGELGFEGLVLQKLPSAWYNAGFWGSFWGFKDSNFYSTDYFSLLPWLFLFLAGYYAERCGRVSAAADADTVETSVGTAAASLNISWLGRHTLLIYLLHQPLLLAGGYICLGLGRQ